MGKTRDLSYQDTIGKTWRIRVVEIQGDTVYVSLKRLDDSTKKMSGQGFKDSDAAVEWARNSIEEVFCGG